MAGLAGDEVAAGVELPPGHELADQEGERGDAAGEQAEPHASSCRRARAADRRHCSATLLSTSTPVLSQSSRGIGIGRQSASSMRMK